MCDCIEKVDVLLAPKNTRVALKLTLNMKTGKERQALTVPTEKIDMKKRGNPVHMFALFCPFCGEKLAQLS